MHKKLLLITSLSLACLLLAPFIGLPSSDAGQQILFDIRTPRVLFAFVAGAGLSIFGMVFQALFRNPLATPFTLGVASGASVGAACYVYLGLSFSVIGIQGVSISAFIGAAVAITLVYLISRLRQGFSTETLLLTGVALSFFFSSLILFIQHLSNMTDSFLITRWLMGELSIVGYHELLQLLPVMIICLAIIISLSKELNLLLTGDDIALSRGVNVKRIRYLLFFTTSLGVGSIVALTGPIGFVGMMVPHICRLIVGHDHQLLTPATILFGGGFLVFCDTFARLIIAPAEIPVGVITTLLGGPFFIWLLLKSKVRIT